MPSSYRVQQSLSRPIDSSARHCSAAATSEYADSSSPDRIYGQSISYPYRCRCRRLVVVVAAAAATAVAGSYIRDAAGHFAENAKNYVVDHCLMAGSEPIPPAEAAITSILHAN